MGASTTENSAGGLKRTYAKGETYTDDKGNTFRIDEKGERRLLSRGGEPAPTKIENTAKPPSAAALEDNPNDSPLVRAAKKRQRAQREAMKMKQED